MYRKCSLIIACLSFCSLKVSAEVNCDGYISPIKWGWMSSAYGKRTDPFTGHFVFHTGIDLATKSTEKAYASQSGIVIFVGEKGQRGKRIEIEHDNSHITTYSHLGSILVTKGDQVIKGQVIGDVGPTTGRSTGPHVGLELIIDGKKTDPEDYVPRPRTCNHLYLAH